MDDDSRSADWKRNPQLEAMLKELEGILAPAQAAALEQAADFQSEWPQVFIVGAPRSGTTLMVQWLAAGGDFAYASNLLSRFYMAPAVGARIQRLLCDPELNFRDELSDLRAENVGFESKLGKTQGALAPNEFWYFWRRFLPTVEIEPLGAKRDQVRGAELRREIGALSHVFKKPFVGKGMMMQYDLDLFAEALPRALFVHVVRDGVSNAQSLLRSRESFFGDTLGWYSAKPPEYADLARLGPEEQVTGQVYWTQEHITRALDALPPERSLQVPYASFCQDPGAYHRQLWERLIQLGGGLDGAPIPSYTGPVGFRCTDIPEADQKSDPALAPLVRVWNALSHSLPPA